VRKAEAPVSTDRDERVKPVPAKLFDEFVGTIHFFYGAIRLPCRATERVASVGRAQDRATQVRYITYGRTPKFHQAAAGIVLWFQESFVAVTNTKDLPAQTTRRIDRAVNDGIQAGRITASGIDCHSSYCVCHQLLPLHVALLQVLQSMRDGVNLEVCGVRAANPLCSIAIPSRMRDTKTFPAYI
jgi:hypothetical protein